MNGSFSKLLYFSLTSTFLAPKFESPHSQDNILSSCPKTSGVLRGDGGGVRY
jgi:hypothetical protein